MLLLIVFSSDNKACKSLTWSSAGTEHFLSLCSAIPEHDDDDDDVCLQSLLLEVKVNQSPRETDKSLSQLLQGLNSVWGRLSVTSDPWMLHSKMMSCSVHVRGQKIWFRLRPAGALKSVCFLPLASADGLVVADLWSVCAAWTKTRKMMQITNKQGRKAGSLLELQEEGNSWVWCQVMFDQFDIESPVKL